VTVRLRGEMGAAALAVVLGALLTARAFCAAEAARTPCTYNVLFVAVDDLRPQLGCYGVQDMRTPAMDALAARGTLFCRAYCQQAVCSPSRTSLLTGRRPDTTKVYDLQTHFRPQLPDVVTLPQHFKQHGYHARSLSKIYHPGFDDPPSWSVPAWFPRVQQYGDPEDLAALAKARAKARAEGRNPRDVRGRSWEAPDVADDALPDGETASKAIEVLREFKDKRFFLAVGFLKPHLPFVAPKKYYDMYPPEKVKLADNPNPPQDVPPIALHNWQELRAYSDIPKEGALPKEKAGELVRGYYAATTYTDAQLGRVLAELEALGLKDNTIVVLWGDHGWHLGEHGLWCKHTNFEVAARAPLLISVPGQKNQGAKTMALAEFVDIYPTLCELCGLPTPSGLEGLSLAPVLNDPQRLWKTAAFSQYPRGRAMGYSMRTEQYRYTEWRQHGQEPAGVELYDHKADPAENVNLAKRPEYADTVAKLKAALQAGWRAALPDGIKAP